MKITFANRIKNAVKAFSENPSQTFFNLTNFGATLRRKSVESDPAGNYAGWVYAAISKRAKRVGAIELKLYDLKRSGDLEELDDHELLALLARANPVQSMYQFFYTIEMMLGIWGSAPVYKDRMGGNRIMYLWPLRPDMLKGVTNAEGKIVKYEYRVGGKVQEFRTEDVIKINEPSPLSLSTGYSPTLAAGLEIDADLAAAVWNKHLIENFAEPGGVLSTEQKLDDKEFERLKQTWNSRQQGPTNAGRTALLEKGLKYEAIGKGPKDMDLVEHRKFERNAITAILGVPMSLLTSEDVNLANAEAGERIFAKDTIEPQMTLIIGSLNEFMVPEFGENLYLDFESPVPADIEKDIRLAEAGEGRFMTPNEARAIFNLPELEGGDAIYKPIGVIPQVGDPSGNTPAADPLKAIKYFEKMEVDASRPTKRHQKIIKAIKARTHMKRKVIEGIQEKVFDKLLAISKAEVKDDNIVLKLPKARLVSKDGEEDVTDTKEHDERLIAERKHFLKALPKKQKTAERQFKKFFQDQEKEVLANLSEYGLPKGRGGRIAAKSTGDKWINKILFDGKNADDGLVEVAGDVYRENIKEGSAAVASLLGLSASDVLTSPFVVKFIDERSFLMLKVNETTREDLKISLREGIALGEDLGEIRERITDIYKNADEFRAETIARTEVGSAQNFGRLAEMQNQKVEKKVWIATFSNTRDDHVAADGQIVGAHEAFHVGGESLDFPGDPKGSPGNIINCQCSVSPTLG